MSPPSTRGLIGWGVGAGLAVSATAVGVVAEQVHRRRGRALETGESLVAEPSAELAVLTTDGVPLHVEVDEPAEGVPTTLTVDGVEHPLPTVVLSHGFCLSSACWVYQRRALTRAGYRVVVWDQRGHGRSEKGDVSSYTIDQLGDDLGHVLAQVVPEGQLLLAGHSMGGMTMLGLAQSQPDLVRDRVRAAAFVSTSPGGMPLASGDLATSVGRVLLERLGPSTAGLFADRPQVLHTLLRANRDLSEFLVERYSFASPVPRSIVKLATRMLLGTDLRVMTSFAPTFTAYDKTVSLAAYRSAEVLVFNGEDDVLTPPSHSEAIVKAIPGAEHLVLRDAGHIIMLEHPDVLNQQLISLGERATRAHAAGIDLSGKPRTLKVVTNVDKQRRIDLARGDRRGRLVGGRRSRSRQA